MHFVIADHALLNEIVPRVLEILTDSMFVHVLRLAQVMFEVVRYISPYSAIPLTQIKGVLILISLSTRWIGPSLSMPSIVLAVVSMYLFVAYQTRRKIQRVRYVTDFACSCGWFAMFAILHGYSGTGHSWVEQFLPGTLWLRVLVSGALRE